MFPTSFNMAGFVLTWGAEASHLCYGFLTKGIGLHIAESVSSRRGRRA